MKVELIVSKLDQIKINTTLITKNLPENTEDFVKLGLVKDGIYKRLEYNIELVIDVCAMINANLKLGIPNDEIDIISNLVDNEVISLELEELILGMKGFRSILVHRYGLINDNVAYKLLKGTLDDFERFEKEIMVYLKKQAR